MAPLAASVVVSFACHGPVDAGLVAAVLGALHRARRKADREQLERVARVLAGSDEPDLVPRFALDAARHRLANTDKSTLLVGDARLGSLDITLIVIPFAWWVLDVTLGEAFRDAWRGTAAHTRLVTVFERDMAADAEMFRATALKELTRFRHVAVFTLHLAHAPTTFTLNVTVRQIEDHQPLPPWYPR